MLTEQERYDEIRNLAHRIDDRQARIAASPMADCTNCLAASHMAALTGICLGCEMAVRVLFDLLVSTNNAGPTDG